MSTTLDLIIKYLNDNKIRATYGAVAEVLDTKAHFVSNRLGDRTAEVSWVVNDKTEMPTGYLPEQCHKDLLSRKAIIRKGSVLKRNIGL